MAMHIDKVTYEVDLAISVVFFISSIMGYFSFNFKMTKIEIFSEWTSLYGGK